MFSFRSLLTLSVVFALPLGAQTISIKPKRPSAVYQTGETVGWTVTVTQPAKLKNGTYKVLLNGQSSLAAGDLILTNGVMEISSPGLADPGWIQLEVDAKDAAGTALQVFGGALFSPDRLARGDDRPADFDAFWDEKIQALDALPMNAVETPGASDRSDVTYSTVVLDGYNSSHIQGQVARPKTGTKFPALFIAQWAGVYSLQKSWATWRASQGWLVLNTQAHDIPVTGTDAYFQNLANTTLKDYSRIGDEDRNTSYFLRMYLACHRAIEYLKSRPDWDGRILVAIGASQGGLQALVTGGLHPDVTAVIAEVPAGNDEGGLYVGRKPGWPVWQWEAWDRDLAKVKVTSTYYDVTNFAKRIHCPTLIGVGAGDGIVPPSGPYVTFNQITSARQIVVMPSGDHNNNHDPYYTVQDAWLAAIKAGTLPTIRIEPKAVVARPGGFVTFSVVATSDTGIGYQWFKDGVSISGATSDRLVVPSASEADVGAYSVTISGPGGSLSKAAGTLTLDAGLAAPPSSALINISTRALVGTGNNQLIAGFAVRGSGAKRVLIRGVGPTLNHFSIGNLLADPKLILTTAANDLIESSDNWNSSPNGDQIRAMAPAVGAFPLDEGSADAALLVSLPPGNYTAILSGAGASSGVGLIEVYDAEPESSARLVNISSRGGIDGSNPLIAGFVVTGTGTKRVLTRAVGPGLSVFGLTPLLAHPNLRLMDSGGSELLSNQGWESSPDFTSLPALASAAGASPALLPGVLDSAIGTTLDTGLYTAVVTGGTGDSGIAIVEVYEMP